MKIKPVKAKNGAGGKPFEVAKVGNVSVPIYRHSNIISQRDAAGKIIYGPLAANGKRSALVEYRSDMNIRLQVETATELDAQPPILDRAFKGDL
jgi:hypothetical protein